MDKRSLLRKSVLLFILLIGTASFVFAQQRTITGKVTDSITGNGLRGVTVRVKEASGVGTITGSNGSYSLTVPAEAKTLVFSSVGYDTKEKSITGNAVNAQLNAGTNLQEVVVVGYGTQRKEDITGAVASVSREDFNSGIVTNPLEQIQGKVAGVVITKPNGDPTSGLTIRLRGQTSLSGGQSPLIVVDGIPLDDPNEISNIAPQDIATYDVLKDASAAAIYGARGANGVILITTKKGRAGRTLVEYNGYVGMEQIANTFDLLSASEWRSAVKKLGLDVTGIDKNANTDWYDAITRTAYTQYHNVAISGGTDQFTYRGSVNYIDQQGIVKTSGKKILTGRLNMEQHALNDKLDIQLGLSYTSKQQKYTDYNVFNLALNYLPVNPIYGPDGNFIDFHDFDYDNPLQVLEMTTNKGIENYAIGRAKISYELLPGLKIGSYGAITRGNYTSDYFAPAIPYYGGISSASRNNNNKYIKTLDVQADYMRDFGEHHLGITAVYEYNKYQYDGFHAGAKGYIVPGLEDNNLGANTIISNDDISSYRNENLLISFLGRLDYNFNNKYYLQINFRRDGSSKFGVNNRWGNFPGASIAWRISKEPFMQTVSFVNDLKIRVGYGTIGNQDAIDPYNSYFLLGSNSGFKFYYNGQVYAGYGVTQNANPDLKWEIRKDFNVGLDFALFNNRLSGSVNVYSDKTDNLLYNYTVPVPPFYINTILANVGTLTNKGVEVQVNANIVKTKDFNWSVMANFNPYETRITSLSGKFSGIDLSFAGGYIPSGYAIGRGLSATPITYLKVGYAPNVFLLPHFVEVDKEGNQVLNPTSDELKPDRDSGFIDPTPKFLYGFNSAFTWKNFDLTFFLQGVAGQKVFANTLLNVENIKRLPGNNVGKAALTNGFTDGAKVSDYWLQDAGYLKMRSISLGYNFKHLPESIAKLRIYVAGNNVFIITPYKGIDPEIKNTGSQAYIDSRDYYPATRSFSFGVNIAFK